MLPAPAASILEGRDHNFTAESLDGTSTCLQLCLLKEGREGSELWLAVNRWSLTTEPDLVENSLTESTKPAVESGKVRSGSSSLGIRYRRAQPDRTLKIFSGEQRDDAQGERLTGKEIQRQDSASRTTRFTLAKRHMNRLSTIGENGASCYPAACQFETASVAPEADLLGHEPTNLIAALAIEVFAKLVKMNGYCVGQFSRRLRHYSIHGGAVSFYALQPTLSEALILARDCPALVPTGLFFK